MAAAASFARRQKAPHSCASSKSCHSASIATDPVPAHMLATAIAAASAKAVVVGLQSAFAASGAVGALQERHSP